MRLEGTIEHMEDRIIWDVAVIGGGPSGMMAAGRAAELGARTILLEKNSALGKKLLITGGGRCNLTNADGDTREFLSKLKGNDKFLFSPFSQMDIQRTLSFFNTRGLKTKVEAEGRVFPVDDKARSVLKTLVAYMKQGRVTVRTKCPVRRLVASEGNIKSIECAEGISVYAKRVIISVGGMSYSETGSTGEGFDWLALLGHAIKKPDASLVPIAIHDTWVKKLQGVTVPDAKMNVMQDGKKRFTRKGRLLFTHFGVSGPTVLNMSRDVRDLLPYGPVTIELDLFPALDHGGMNEKLEKLFRKEGNKKFKNVAGVLVVGATFRKVIVGLSKINPDKFCHSVTREERLKLVAILKGVQMRVEGVLGKNKAIITSGGVPLTEVDTKTMRSKLCGNLYLTGDVLDIDRPSGGYSLQLCWTTGYVAGTAAAHSVSGNKK